QKAVERHLAVGDKVNVQILKIDWDRNRISLGVKQLQQDPFEAVGSEVVEGAELSGRVTRLADFGAFIEVARGVEGLVHISELDHRRVAHPGDVLKEDEIVKVKVLKIDPQTRKISLSVKALKEAPASSGGGGRGRGGPKDTRSPDEILKDTPALRRMREKFGKQGFKGGLG
ncbi:MAG: S1 RNA-binding domain-containing protein, partial [Phycisphaerales bacterium]|nr:S1 RNA-binding domain-containing protein [Phycisphaerales bacterium]